jgi:hypothetical protein
MNIEVSNAEILDKLSILKLKLKFINDPVKNFNIQREYDYINNISKALISNNTIITLYEQLLEINQILWNIEDQIRKKEQNKTFDEEFIQLARQVYITNDKRAEIKKQINVISQSKFIEEKFYEKY